MQPISSYLFTFNKLIAAMGLFSTIFVQENSIEIVYKVLSHFDIKIFDDEIEESMMRHPDYPSLLSICDILDEQDVATATIRASIDDLLKFNTPLIVPVRAENGDEMFAYIKEVHPHKIRYYDTKKGKDIICTMTAFDAIWESRIVTIVEYDGRISRKQDKVSKTANTNPPKLLTIILIGLFAFVPLISAILKYGWIASYSLILLSVTTILGVVVCAALLFYEINKVKFSDRVCSTTRRTNCYAILNSPASNIGKVSLSIFGMSYFIGSFIFQSLSSPLDPIANTIFAYINFVAYPYLVFAIYYQWRVAKRWCSLCIATKLIILIQTALVLTHYQTGHTILEALLAEKNIEKLVVSFVAPMVTIITISALAKKNKKLQKENQKLNKIKFDSSVFTQILRNERELIPTPNEVGIIVGNPNANYKIIQVCNPYCSPCAASHSILESVLECSPDLQVQIIFNASGEPEDPKSNPVRYFMTVMEIYGSEVAQKMVKEWYGGSHKNYLDFVKSKSEIVISDSSLKKVQDMHSWCKQNKVTATPTLFLNSHQLPAQYEITDLHYLINS